MQLVIDFYFLSICIYIYNSICFERQAIIIRSLVALSCKKTVPRTDTNTETGGCMYSEGRLMMSA
jgi:hypothetical protein